MIWSLVGAVFAMSLLGSLHCAGMCGAFVAIATVGQTQSRSERVRLLAAYNLGRLLTYMTLGAVAGAVGGAIDAGGAILGVQRIAIVLAGSCMIAFASISLLRHAGVSVAKLRVPAFMNRWLIGSHRRISHWPDAPRALAIGLLTTLLPCGWLYAYVFVAAGTGSVLGASLIMAVFWLGTLPMMVTLGVGLSALMGPLKARLPVLTMLLLLATGLFTVLGRTMMSSQITELQHSLTSGDSEANAAEARLASMQRGERPVCHGN